MEKSYVLLCTISRWCSYKFCGEWHALAIFWTMHQPNPSTIAHCWLHLYQHHNQPKGLRELCQPLAQSWMSKRQICSFQWNCCLKEFPLLILREREREIFLDGIHLCTVHNFAFQQFGGMIVSVKNLYGQLILAFFVNNKMHQTKMRNRPVYLPTSPGHHLTRLCPPGHNQVFSFGMSAYWRFHQGTLWLQQR